MENKFYILKSSAGEIVCQRMLVVNQLFSRMKGLMFSLELPDCDGFLIAPCNSIHTFFMLYKLDVVFLDKNFVVIKVLYDLSPWRMTWFYIKASQVLEMKAGTLSKKINIGENLEAICIN
jgi:uncharacterized membrane protein (UPF0127 family)